MRKPEIDYIQKFCRDVSLKRFTSHSLNDGIKLVDKDQSQTMSGNVWKCGILWGNEDIKGLIIVNFTTINILAMASSIFENTNDTVLFEHTKDFMKEYCNLYAGLIKGTLNNEKIYTNISLPIISKSLSRDACLGGTPKRIYEDSWSLTLGNSFIEINSSLVFSEKFDINSLSFLNSNDSEISSSDGDLEFF